MKKVIHIILFNTILFCADDVSEIKDTLSKPLKPFQPFIGKTFKGELTTSTSLKPMIDILRWERALNGNAIRVIHSVNDGEYGGETLIMWDPEFDSLASWYFTTGGYYTRSKINIESDRLIFIEDVSGNNNGITKVKTMVRILPGGKLQNRSKFLMNDIWVEGYETFYKKDPNADIIFK